jgi:hypothetical protein
MERPAGGASFRTARLPPQGSKAFLRAARRARNGILTGGRFPFTTKAVWGHLRRNEKRKLASIAAVAIGRSLRCCLEPKFPLFFGQAKKLRSAQALHFKPEQPRFFGLTEDSPAFRRDERLHERREDGRRGPALSVASVGYATSSPYRISVCRGSDVSGLALRPECPEAPVPPFDSSRVGPHPSLSG